MKKFISLFVIVTMIVACMTFTVSANDVTSVDALILDGTTVNKLTADIDAGEFVLSLNDAASVIVDLNGHTWTSSNVVIDVIGGNCFAKVYDSSEAKTGAIVSRANDAISISNGELTLENITVTAGDGGMDAVFVNGGKVTITNCTLSAGKAGIDASNGSEAAGVPAIITVNGGKFANFAGAAAQRNCAIELRNSGANGPKVTLNGAITFENNKIIMRNDYTKAVNEGIIAGTDATAEFADVVAGSFTETSTAYTVTTITYAYTGTGETPDAGEGETPDAGETPDNPETSDALVVAIVTVAMIALAGVVVSKKVRA